MPKLNYVYINALDERTAYGSLSSDFEAMVSHSPNRGIQTLDRDETVLILAALCSDLWTTLCRGIPLEAQGVTYPYTVGLRKARAAEWDEIVCRDGKWERPEDSSSTISESSDE